MLNNMANAKNQSINRQIRNYLDYLKSPNDSEENAIQRQWAFGRTLWTNAFWKDWIIYQNNNHPFWGIIAVDKQNPFTRLDRVLVLFACLAFSAYLSVYTSISINDAVEECGSDPVCIANVNVTYSNFNLLFGLVITIFEICLRAIATCRCAYTSKTICCKKTGICCSATTTRLISLVSLVFVILTGTELNSQHVMIGNWAGAFIMNQILWWILNIITGTALFIVYWYYERCLYREILQNYETNAENNKTDNLHSIVPEVPGVQLSTLNSGTNSVDIPGLVNSTSPALIIQSSPIISNILEPIKEDNTILELKTNKSNDNFTDLNIKNHHIRYAKHMRSKSMFIEANPRKIQFNIAHHSLTPTPVNTPKNRTKTSYSFSKEERENGLKILRQMMKDDKS